MDKDLVAFARKQAQKNHRSVSGMFSDYLNVIRRQSEKPVASVAEMAGSLKNYSIDDSKENIRAIYAKKHSR